MHLTTIHIFALMLIEARLNNDKSNFTAALFAHKALKRNEPVIYLSEQIAEQMQVKANYLIL